MGILPPHRGRGRRPNGMGGGLDPESSRIPAGRGVRHSVAVHSDHTLHTDNRFPRNPAPAGSPPAPVAPCIHPPQSPRPGRGPCRRPAKSAEGGSIRHRSTDPAESVTGHPAFRGFGRSGLARTGRHRHQRSFKDLDLHPSPLLITHRVDAHEARRPRVIDAIRRSKTLTEPRNAADPAGSTGHEWGVLRHFEMDSDHDAEYEIPREILGQPPLTGDRMPSEGESARGGREPVTRNPRQPPDKSDPDSE